MVVKSGEDGLKDTDEKKKNKLTLRAVSLRQKGRKQVVQDVLWRTRDKI